MRIVSLLASGTELTCALGAGDSLVGRSHECDYPEWVKKLPVVSKPTFDVSGSSGDIDTRVREKLKAGEPLYEVNHALLLKLKPDVILTQTHCEVCAVSPNDVQGPAELKRNHVATLHTGTLDGVLEGFIQTGEVLERKTEAEELVERIQKHVNSISKITATLPSKTMAAIEWIEPVFPMGNWGPELVKLAGAVDVLGIPTGSRSTTAPWDELRRNDPEHIVIAPCGFDIYRTLSERHVLESLPGWSSLKAVQNGSVFVADGNRFFNRSSPSLFESLDILVEILHPDRFEPERCGKFWRRL